MRIILTLIVWLSISSLMNAQTNWQQQYLKAKDFYATEKYALAMEAFKPLIDESPGNNFSAYSSFYYALSAYQSDYLPLGRDMLLQVKSRYSSWSKIDEVNYWLGLIYFEQQQYNQGISVLNEISSKKTKNDIRDLKTHYFSQIEQSETIHGLHENHPQDEVLAYLLAKSIADQPLVNQDQKLLRDIINEFNFNAEEFNVLKVSKSILKDEYKVAVLLPFMTDDLEPNLKRKVNQFVLDLYLGIELAADTLKAQGVNIELFAYDTKRSEKVTKEITEKEELKGMDLIIGPLYARTINVINEFSFKNKINVVNPLSSNSDVIGNNPFAFLFFPSDETIGRASAEYTCESLDDKPGIIFYEDNASDSAKAFAYLQRVTADSINIIATQKIRKDDSRVILDMLLIKNSKLSEVSSEESKEKYTIKLDSIGHIFVASNNDLISSKVLSAVETRGDSIVVIGSADWLNLSVITYDTYFKLGTVLYAPNYIITNSEEYSQFRRDYILKHKKIPQKYAEIGYELMYLMGNGLHKHGKYFQIGWEEKGVVEGHLTAGFNYTNSNDNLLIPLLKFNKEEVDIILENDKSE